MLRLVFWLFVLFLALSFFGISIQSIIHSPAGQTNLSYLGNLLSGAWQWIMLYVHYLALKVMGAATMTAQ